MGNDVRLKDINFLIESAKSCNDFSIGAILRSAETLERVLQKNVAISCNLYRTASKTWDIVIFANKTKRKDVFSLSRKKDNEEII